MSAIHDAILLMVSDSLTKALITDPTAANALLLDSLGALIPGKKLDDAIAGIVKIGPLQGDPDPDVARISVELYENDPDGGWQDVVGMLECGGGAGSGITWRRRFTALARCLLVVTQEDLSNARRVGSTVRSRIEKALLKTSFAALVSDDGEIVVRGITSENVRGEMSQFGGPPDAYDIHIKIRFEVLTQN